ncbi:zinc/cadmium/mercury/lead-transporting ATPase [Vibrio fluvialis]|uniref:zinc/cadmium/mercury/lead-transporting ATPase n=1 Tax=Vibrio fluvialis TaxID=676 RepID=UPI001C9D27CE|nr:zinc/cadmium/mercury/lead-transporting ATPase [Vibrio fluvialis]EKO3963806.1 zinc/cadmium/mercury/lead-transporting ATPase [Vibrio fluvialis]MBY7763766.1 zinc/cadmium/mercury/lead-transporting ATPase [Vibrio fluvialis]MBY7772377.1 zinc/cadmium/mercury/lead-transporting ATPase [Vibrio fluvialis]MBY7777089.1 zinc/cadmium/mercury/lead-transporting ATPase [Vibrio fluvialis]MBY7985989.1 zinc/cadmium/mercury/lead-transporting ATPase [Vibrio fluvialis]
MCTKHEGCRSEKSAAPTIKSVSCSASPKIQSIHPAGATNSEGGCCSSSSCSGADGPDEDEPAGGTSTYKQSWRVVGMDCPSCARKIETAVNQLTDIVDARVLFATEKLVVQFNSASTAAAIEQAVTNTGFKIYDDQQKSSAQPAKPSHPLFEADTLRIVALAAMMAIGTLTNLWSVEAGRWIFTISCIAGLVPIATKAWKLAKSGTPFAIETLMTVAAVGALYLGETVEAAMVLLLFLIGERLEAFAASKARSGVQALMELVPETAVRLQSGERIEVPASELSPGDIVEVAPGGRLPADGLLLDAVASMDESALTGESLPVEHVRGDKIAAGAVVVDRVIQLKITSRQGENAIDRILHLIEEADSRKAPMERFLDQFSRWYTPLMMVVALLVVTVPPLLFAQPWETWVYRGLAMLLIACPCALVISTPAAITSGLAAGARRGALIKGGAALEQLGRIQSVAFDKTGTLTQGKPQVTDIVALSGLSPDQLLTVTAAIEQGSRHPLAMSLVKKAQNQGLTLPHAQDKQALVGRGVAGRIGEHFYRVLAPGKVDVPLADSVSEQVAAMEAQGKTVVVALENDTPIGIIAWQDTLREDAQQAIAALHQMGIHTTMLTGDNPRSAQAIASQLNMDFQASLMPEDKVEYVRQLAQQQHVAMVGDGINDAPAMKEANIGIAMGGGTDVALETADAAITHNRLNELPGMIALSRATLSNIRQNVTIALGLKGIFLVTSLIGVTGLWVAVLADSGATALVTLNALRLLKFKK